MKKTGKKHTAAIKKKELFSEKNKYLIPYFTLFFAAIILYGWSYTFNVSLDDEYISKPLSNLENSISSFRSVFSLWYSGMDYRPITMISFWLQKLIAGNISPGVSHIINVILFAFLLTRIYYFIIVARFFEDENKLHALAFLTALLFLVHPNHVSVVANIKSRDNLLSMLFGLMAAIQFIKLFDLKQWWRVVSFVVLCLLSLLSKMDGYVFVFLPSLIFLLYRKVQRKMAVYIILPMILFFVLIALRGYLMTNLLDVKYKFSGIRNLAENPLFIYDSLANRISMTCISLLYYVKFLVVPWGYYFYFGYNQIPLLPLFHPFNLLAVVLFILLIIGGIYRYKNNRIYIFSIVFFLLSIAYAANLFQPVAGIVMDRYNFIPSLAFCIAMAVLFIDIFRIENMQDIIKHKFILLILIVYSGFTLYRLSAWKDEMTLFERDIPYLTKSFNANRMMAGAYVNKGLAEDMKPDVSRKLADAYMLKGQYYADKAISIYDSIAMIWETKAIIELYFKRNRSAIADLNKCIQIDSVYFTGLNYMGVAYMFMNNYDSAHYFYNRSIEKENAYGYGAQNLIDLLLNNKKFKEADSVLNVLSHRFPNDIKLKEKIETAGTQIRSSGFPANE